MGVMEHSEQGEHRVPMQLSGERDDTGAVIFQSAMNVGSKLQPFTISVGMDAWRAMGEPLEMVLRVKPMVAIPKWLRPQGGWWYCDCEKSCKCGGVPKKLNPPELRSCAGCGARRP